VQSFVPPRQYFVPLVGKVSICEADHISLEDKAVILLSEVYEAIRRNNPGLSSHAAEQATIEVMPRLFKR
jgi:hypothetical protein